MARKELRTNPGIVAQLKALLTNQDVVPYAVKQELIDLGYIAEKERVVTDAIKAATRGRKKIVYGATARGKQLINLSKSWKSVA
jgi:hypothetical protein